MKSKVYIVLLMMTAFLSFAHLASAQVQGKVTFITSNSVYVRFERTDGIEVGDTLWLNKDNTTSACLVVKNKSSTSCACTLIDGCDVKVDDTISAPISNNPAAQIKVPSKKKPYEISKLSDREIIRGRVSATSYGTLSQKAGNTHRTMYRFSLDARRINNSKFSFETHLNYRQNFIPSDRNSAQKKNLFNIYSASVSYQMDSTLALSIGRRINNKVISLGMVDGVQVEKNLGHFYTGAIAGFRPDIFDNSFNSNLLQYGGYAGVNLNRRDLTTQSTVGVLEQKNSGNVDRRYVYFQHSSTFMRKLNLFSTMELDLYNQVNGVSVSNTRLTNLLLSASYRVNRKTNVSLSYDARKRILYYETFRTEIDQLLADDDTRQQIRVRLNTRAFKNLSVGVSYARRFQSNALNKSNSINAYLNVPKIPNIGGRLSLNINTTQSDYLRSNIASIRHSRSFFKNKLNADFYFRFVRYSYLNRELQSSQKYYGTNLSYRLSKSLTLSVLGEMGARQEETNYRIYTRVIKRFNKK